MQPLSNWKQFLDAVQKRPGLFWGGGERPFTSLVAFLDGYRLGFEEGSRAVGISPSDLVPADFHKFVTERFGREFPDGGKGWMTLIEEHTNSESEAFQLFFRLRYEYAASHVEPAEPGASPNGGPATPVGNSEVTEGPPSVS